jgi:pyruvate formate lyase activating enzyme
VYLGNVPGEGGEDTICPHCEEVLIKRLGFRIAEMKIINRSCSNCGTAIEGVWE